MMLKRTLRVFITIILTLDLTTGFVLAMTEDANAATVSMKTIPATSAKADSRVVNAFVELGFTVKYNKNLGYAGVFSVADHAIHLKTRNKTNTLHEMGHFVSRLQNGADETSEFVKIYKSEKKKYNGTQKSYITKNSKEYFAQSFAEYTQNPSKLKKSRPKTYKYVKTQVDTIEQQDVDNMYSAYGWAW